MLTGNTVRFNSPLRIYLEKLYGKKLSEQEFNKYKTELVDIFSVLIEVDRRNKKKVNENI